MKARTIRENVYLIGHVDWDRRLFDALIPLPDGTSYNAYFVRGSRQSALIDTVDPAAWATLAAQLDELPEPDYLVVHHVEQDHSGSAPMLLERYPRLTVVCNEKAKAMLVDHLHVDDARFRVVTDGETLSLGDKTLRFVFTPWVHWPETMCTWLIEDKILLSCDFFGSHLATSDLFADPGAVYEGAKRYYAEIMMPFGPQVLKNIDKVARHPIEIIGPSHGPVYDDPRFIIDAYRDWAGGELRNIVCLPFVSMHDSTRLMVDHLTGALAERGVAVERFDLTTLDAGELASSLVYAAHDRPGHADRAHRPAPAGRRRRLFGQRAAAAGQVRDGDRLVRLGRQDGRDDPGAARPPQARVPRAGDGEGPAARGRLRGARPARRHDRRQAPRPGAAALSRRPVQSFFCCRSRMMPTRPLLRPMAIAGSSRSSL